MSITAVAPTESHGNLTVPKDPYKFAKDIQHAQERYKSIGSFERILSEEHKILFNKGRYFETSIYNAEIREQVSKLADIPVTYNNNMIVASWKKLEDFVIAMNILGIYVEIDVDWI